MKKIYLLALTAAVALLVFAPGVLADDGGRPISVVMLGANEAPNPGDPDGIGQASFTFNPGQGEICYDLTVTGIAPATASHIHRAPVGVPGPVVVPLSPPTGGHSSGCASVDRDLVLEIMQNPGEFYVNVHNAEYPSGALRGQLSK